MAPRLASPVTLVGACALLVLWMGWTLWSLSLRVERIGADVTELSAEVSSGLTGLEGKIDLMTGQLRHAQPGGFDDKSPQQAAGSDAVLVRLSQMTRTLEDQLQRLAQGVQHVDRLKQQLETAVKLAETSFAAGGLGGGHGHAMADMDNKGRDGADGGGRGGAGFTDVAVERVRRGGERGLKSQADFGRPATLRGGPPDDNANEALSQRTLKLNAGDPLPLVGRAFHPWYANADHSKHPT
jgi:hypothetical protein